MPKMYEIYERHAREYDELISAEDYMEHLGPALASVVQWDGAMVAEAGTGTGRVTSLYADKATAIVCFDRSSHMLEAARSNLAPWAEKISFTTGDNLALPVEPVLDRFAGKRADILVEGWAYGHAVMDSGKPAATCRQLIASSTALIRDGGTVIIVETLGTAVDSPQAPHPLLEAFYLELEQAHGFKRVEISTDYRFASLEEAERVMGFFFGDAMAEEVRRRGDIIVPEWTGLWYRRY